MTATAVRALKDYAPVHMRSQIDADIARAAAWLKQAKPDSTQERVYLLLGLRWSDAGRSAITTAGRALCTRTTPRRWLVSVADARERCLRDR